MLPNTTALERAEAVHAGLLGDARAMLASSRPADGARTREYVGGFGRRRAGNGASLSLTHGQLEVRGAAPQARAPRQSAMRVARREARVELARIMLHLRGGALSR
jgi:hypothetical protein